MKYFDRGRITTNHTSELSFGFVLHRTNPVAWLGHHWQQSKGGTSMSSWQGLGFLAGMEELGGGLAFWCHLDGGGVNFKSSKGITSFRLA